MRTIYQPNEHMPFDAVILGNGDFPTHPLALYLLKNAPYICCCDGAGRTLIEHKIMPHAIVGDGDSLTEDFKQKYKSLVHIVQEQDDNDLTKATRHCMALGFKRILYLGITGKREDHALANIFLMLRYYKEFNLEPMAITNEGWLVPSSNETLFKVENTQKVSIFNDNCTQLTSTNLKWNAYAYTHLWQGTLNRTTHTDVTMNGDGFYMLFFVWK